MFKKIKYIIILLSFICVVCIGAYHLLNPFVSIHTLEAGDSLKVEDLLVRDTQNAKIIQNLNDIQTKKIGEYEIKASYYFIPYTIKVKVEDTIPPLAAIIEKKMWIGDEINASMFVKDIKDVTEVKCSFQNEPILNKEGQQNLIIVLEDEGHNKTKYETTLTLKKDTIPPVMSGVNTIIVNLDENIQYKKYIKVKDNRDEDIDIHVDTSKVNYDKPGTYTVVYTAKDKAGNSSSKTVDVIILSEKEQNIKKETLELGEKFIKKLTKENMTVEKKLEVCFDYIRKNVTYNGLHKGDKENYYIDARTGFSTMKGDCLVSNGMFRVVAEILDVPTIVVERSSKDRSHHYWVLLDTGDGWYHYDAFNQHNRIYRWSDEHLTSWSKAHHNYQEYDQSLYPKTPLKE